MSVGARWAMVLMRAGLAMLLAIPQSAMAQTVTTLTTTTTGAINNSTCSPSVPLVRTFTVASSFIIGDVDVGVMVSHPNRGDLLITLVGAGKAITLMNWSPATLQPGDNINDYFDDEATVGYASHDPTANDPIVTPYFHSFKPKLALSLLDGRNAQGNWSLQICDSTSTDSGTFLRADIYMASMGLGMTKSSKVLSDPVNGTTNPKALPGAVMQFCLLATNNGIAVAPHATLAITSLSVPDAIPGGVTYVPGSMLSGSTCETAATPEDDDNTGADETDPIGMSISGTSITGTATSLAPGETMAMVFNVTIN
jgi:subtilisin-like proprotein convertase family protein